MSVNNRNMRRSVLSSICLLLSLMAKAQVATILEDSTDIEYKSPTNCVTYHRLTVLISSERGNGHAAFHAQGSDSRSMTGFSGKLEYTDGSKGVKIRQSDLLRSEYSKEMASDSYFYHYEPSPARYPYIVTYEWTMSDQDAIFVLQPFVPQDAADVNVKHAVCNVTYNPEHKMLTAFNHMTPPDAKTLPDGRCRMTIHVDDLPAIKDEIFMPDPDQFLPIAYFIPETFKVGSTSGVMSSWEEYGKWLYQLMQGRGELTGAIKQKLHELTDGVQDPYVKLLKVYRLLEETTRYVSIQLGIGGWQPAKASEVSTRGFGDCKGLSNYMVAMLKEVGIEADYAVICMDHHRHIPDDLANVALLNHAIVRARLPERDVWIECTNPKLPLGYIHEGIAGHDAILVTEQGGKRITLPGYDATENTDSIHIGIVVNADGSATLKVTEEEHNVCFEHSMPLLDAKSDDQRKSIRNLLTLPDFTFLSHSVSQGKRNDRVSEERQPVLVTQFEGTSRRYANITGTRLFVSPFPLSLMGKTTPTKQRINPVQITDNDRSVCLLSELTIPEGYEVEYIPEATEEKTEYGTISFSHEADGNIIKSTLRLSLSSTVFPSDKYQEICQFINKQAELVNTKIVIKKLIINN